MNIPTLRQFETAKMVHQVKEPDHVLTKIDYETFVELYKEMYNPKRNYQYVCAMYPKHAVSIVRRGYVVQDALTGEETDGDMSCDDMNCNTCGDNEETVVDEYRVEDFIGEGKC